MYSEEELKAFAKRTQDLLAVRDEDIKKQEVAGQVVNDLIDVINFHDHLYYIAAGPIISDYEYDTLFKKLKLIEELFLALKSPESPTQRVAFGLTKEFPSVLHITPMLSLDNSYNENDLIEFDKKVRNSTGIDAIEYSVEPKLDGASISLIYEDDVLLRGVSRGDGVMGEDITPNVKVMKSVPLRAKFSDFGIKTIEIRGEVVIRKDVFVKINAKRTEEGLPTLANPRNSAAGSLRMQDQAEVAKRGLEAMLYHISYAVDAEGNDLLTETMKTRTENFRLLRKLGFKTPEQECHKGIKSVIGYCEEWAEKRDNYPYEIDGMVVKVDSIPLEEKLGSTSHHPRWAMAYKFKARQGRTKLLNVEFQVGRIGTITPVAKLSPVFIGGVTVTSASMFNEEFIAEKDIRIGDEVLVERAGDVIPYIAEVVKEARKGNEKPLEFPRNCPSCGSELMKNENEAAWRCVNTACPAQMYFRMTHFVSKDAMDISGLGKALIDKFMEKRWLSSYPDIYRLPYYQIEQLEGFGQKSVEKIKSSIEASKDRSLARLIYAFGIRHVGQATARNLADEVTCVEELREKSLEQLSEIEDIGPIVAESIYDFFQSEENMQMIAELKELGVSVCRNEKATNKEGGILSGQVFLFTGTLTKFTRNEAKDLVENAGGTVAGSLSSKVNYLVVGADPGSKAEKAKKLNVAMIDEDKFLEMLK